MNSDEVVKEAVLRSVLNDPPNISSNSAHEVRATLVADTGCLLGECVLYNDESNAVCWTDIDGKALYCLSLEDGSLKKTTLPRMLGAFCLTTQKDVILCGWENGFQLWNVETETEISEYSRGPPVNPKGLPSRLNDGRCDPTGERFICGGFFGNDERVRTKVYSCRFDKDGRLQHEAIIDNVKITNSLCFSPSGDIMYFCDSPTKTIQQYEYKDGQATSPQKVWSWDQEKIGFPDGSCVDEEGFIWSALWRSGDGPGRIHRIDPASGSVVFTIHIPDTTSQCTCVCFGGMYLNVLFITTASIGRDSLVEPQAGGLYAVKVPFRGRLESRFRLKQGAEET
jgi:L-arabinonolactonase